MLMNNLEAVENIPAIFLVYLSYNFFSFFLFFAFEFACLCLKSMLIDAVTIQQKM